MKKSFLWVFTLTIFVLSACTNDNANEEPKPVPVPKTQSAINKIVSGIEEVIDTLEARGPITILRDSVNVEVTAYVQGDDPVIIRAQYPQKEEWYYLLNRQTIMLREYLFGQNGDASVQEYQFFYGPDGALGARSRQGANRQELISVSFSKENVAESDPRMDAEAVSTSAINFIYGR